MARHKFWVGVYENGVVVGARCIKCAVTVLYVDGKIPDDIDEQECKPEGASQSADGV